MPRNALVAVIVAGLMKEPISTFHNDFGNKKLRDMLISGHVTLGNDLRNYCRNKFARQVLFAYLKQVGNRN